MESNLHTAERKIGPVAFYLETGRLAKLADGAVFGQIGETSIIVAATASNKPRDGVDFFPLTIDVEERLYAAGKIPGSVFRREGRPTEKAILNARLIDRPLRPCFPDGFRNEVHVVVTVQSVDFTYLPDILAINGSSAALMLSGIPFEGPVGAVRLAHIEGAWRANPTLQDLEEGTFEMVVAGRQGPSGDADILMVEAGALETAFDRVGEGAPQIDEEIVADGLQESKAYILEAVGLQQDLVAKAGVRKQRKVFELFRDYEDDVFTKVEQSAGSRLDSALSEFDKETREDALKDIESELKESLADEFAEREGEVSSAFRSLTKKAVRARVLKDGTRLDGRSPTDVRPISGEVSLIPRVHGSGLFNRGETQVLSLLTLGMLKMEQVVGFDDLGTAESKRYMHHYNFPPFSTGETGFMRGPKRREIGHGALAEKALLPVVPGEDDFPYALRIVSEVLSSNGSTSMASVCGSTLCMMDAGVPLRDPVAGVAMGLISQDGEFVTLTDILGTEDAFGDMDFKVAGTESMITALQLDTKISGIPADVLGKALAQAREGRLHILAKMKEILDGPRPELNPNAPRIIAIKIPVDSIGDIIGPKGKMINALTEEFGVEIDVEDDGTIRVGGMDGAQTEAAIERIEEIANPRIPEIGEKFAGKVVKIAAFGAFVNLTPARDGLLHISKLGGGIRIERVEDVLSEGDEVQVEVGDIDDRGKISLDLVEPLPRVKELPEDYGKRSERPGRDRDRGRGDRPRGDRDRDSSSRRTRPRRRPPEDT